MRDANCIFCKIVAGELPAYKIHEDQHTLAFFDIAPFEKGHALVISKYHANFVTDLPVAELAPLIQTVQLVGARMLQALPCDGFNILQNNGACASQVVPHVHFHVIPRWNNKPLNWSGRKYDDMNTELAALQQRFEQVAATIKP